MRLSTLFIATLLGLTATARAADPWRLVWSDEFEGTGRWGAPGNWLASQRNSRAGWDRWGAPEIGWLANEIRGRLPGGQVLEILGGWRGPS